MDDYTHNLNLWEPPARGIKLLNGINHTKGTWQGSTLRYDNKDPQELAYNIIDIMDGAVIRDEQPLSQRMEQVTATYDPGDRTGYVPEEKTDNLPTVTQEEAIEALKAGIHICSLDPRPVAEGPYEGMHVIQELGSLRELAQLQEAEGPYFGRQVYISPYYENPQKVRTVLLESMEREQKGTEKPLAAGEYENQKEPAREAYGGKTKIMDLQSRPLQSKPLQSKSLQSRPLQPRPLQPKEPKL